MKKVLLLIICCLASVIFCAGGAWGSITAVYCVDPAGGVGVTHTNLQTALTDAAGNITPDIIKVVQETYTGPFEYYSTNGQSIELQGGWTAGCLSRGINPANTILDGGSSGAALYLNNNTGGSITVDGFTMHNGVSSTHGGGVYAYSYSDAGTAGTITITNNTVTKNSASSEGGGIFARSNSNSGTAGNITITNNTVRGNASGGFGGGILAYSYSTSGAAGTVTLINNIIAGNTSNTHGGGGAYASSVSDSGSGGTVTLTNNTITENTAAASGGGGLFTYRDGNTINVYNNIIWGNTASSGGADIYSTGSGGTANSYNNNYHEMTGTWDNESGKIDADPLFVDASVSNYRLSSTSPCIDAGNNSAPGLPSTDIDGNARIITNNVDMGAYEYLCSNNLFKIGGTIYSYASIHAAYEAMTGGDTMQIHTSEYSEALALDLDKIVTLKGGYDCNFTSNTGYTTVNGSLTISNGTVTIENITVK